MANNLSRNLTELINSGFETDDTGEPVTIGNCESINELLGSVHPDTIRKLEAETETLSPREFGVALNYGTDLFSEEEKENVRAKCPTLIRFLDRLLDAYYNCNDEAETELQANPF